MKSLSILSTLLLAGGCAGGGVEAADPADLAPAVNAFSADLYRAVADGDENLFLSPASVSYALAMTGTGARGATAAEIAAVLRLPAGDVASAAAGYGTLMAALQAEQDGPVTLRLANRLWGQEGFPFRREFVDDVDRHFAGGFETADYRAAPEAARVRINDWVSAQTNAKIPELLDRGTVRSDTRLVLVNAIYFLADWASAFDPDLTRPARFHLPDGGTPDVPTMHQTAEFGYREDDDVQLLVMPYEGGAVEMVVLLPAPELGLGGLEKSLTDERLAALLAPAPAREVRVLLPKFEYRSEFRLKPVLGGMGMPTAFTGRADFSGMAEQGDLAIDEVVHKTYVRVDEEGTEAAAATGVIMKATSVGPPVPMFRADRPFVFLIRHVETGAVLFIGRVTDPRAT